MPKKSDLNIKFYDKMHNSELNLANHCDDAYAYDDDDCFDGSNENVVVTAQCTCGK